MQRGGLDGRTAFQSEGDATRVRLRMTSEGWIKNGDSMNEKSPTVYIWRVQRVQCVRQMDFYLLAPPITTSISPLSIVPLFGCVSDPFLLYRLPFTPLTLTLHLIHHANSTASPNHSPRRNNDPRGIHQHPTGSPHYAGLLLPEYA